MEKGSFDNERLNLWAPVVKGHKGKYTAILSDDSIDRDGEVVSKEAMLKIKDDETFLAALINHKNDILGMVGQWINRRVEMIDGHNTLMAEVKFFEKNSNAKEIKGMLDEGAPMGVSIGAIVNDKETKEILGKDRTVYKDLELVEASFVAIPSNRHAHAVAVAKSYEANKSDDGKGRVRYKNPIDGYKEDGSHNHEELESAIGSLHGRVNSLESLKSSNYKKNKEVTKMSDEEKPVEDPVEEPESNEEGKTEPEADKKVDAEVEKLNKTISDKESEFNKSLTEVKTELAETKKELDDLRNLAVHKARQEPVDEPLSEEQQKTAIEADIKAGKIPVLIK